jgi:hypothetical protein
MATCTALPAPRYLHGRAEILHINYYDLKDELNAETIGNDIDAMAELIEILYPLTGLTPTDKTLRQPVQDHSLRRDRTATGPNRIPGKQLQSL